MTLPRKQAKCRWCGAGFAVSTAPGRPRLYCRRSHRQRALEARRQARARGLGTDEVILSRSAWADFTDHLYVLETTLEDVKNDTRGSPSMAEFRQALIDLEEAARLALARRPDPKAAF